MKFKYFCNATIKHLNKYNISINLFHCTFFQSIFQFKKSKNRIIFLENKEIFNSMIYINFHFSSIFITKR